MHLYIIFFYFQKYNKNDLEVELTAERLTDLDETTKTWLMEVLEKNMKALYEESDWGWKESTKRYVQFLIYDQGERTIAKALSCTESS